MVNNKITICAEYKRIDKDLYMFGGLITEEDAKVKERFGGDFYKVIRLELPRRLNRESQMELVIKDPRYETPKLDDIKLDVLEGIVY